MPYTTQNVGSAPFKDLNVTPFIDVLLVLIIMLIMTIPIMTHSVEVDLPSPDGGRPSNPTMNVVGITANDQLLWNGKAIDQDTLKSSIARSLTMPEEPLLRFSPDPSASYDTSAKTIALIKDSGSKKFAFDGLHKHREFDRAR